MTNSKLELVVVDTQHANPYLYCFADSMEEAKEWQAKAYEQRAKDAARYALLMDTHPNNQNYKLYWEEARGAKFEVMTFAEYQALQRKYFLTRPIEEVSEECFNNALDCLPPLCWTTIGGVEMFCLCEMYSGTFTSQYAKVGNRCFRALVDVKDRSTWIHNRLSEIPEQEEQAQ